MHTTKETFPTFMSGIDFNDLHQNLKQAILYIENNKPFTSFSIVVTSKTIISLINEMIPKIDLLPFGSDAIIHKHMRRDRSSILQKREEKKKGRY